MILLLELADTDTKLVGQNQGVFIYTTADLGINDSVIGSYYVGLAHQAPTSKWMLDIVNTRVPVEYWSSYVATRGILNGAEPGCR